MLLNNSPQFPSIPLLPLRLRMPSMPLPRVVIRTKVGSTEHAALAFCLHHGPDPERSD